MTAVAVWASAPTVQALLDDRLARGWRPTPTLLRSGPTVLGAAAVVPQEQWRRADLPEERP